MERFGYIFGNPARKKETGCHPECKEQKKKKSSITPFSIDRYDLNPG